MSLDFPQHVITRYCALAYSRPEPQSTEDVIILLVQLGLNQWKLLVDPAWLSTVGPDDQEYVQELLDDMKVRVSFDPDALLKQLSEVSVGPLLTFAVGFNLEANPQLLEKLRSFVES